MADGIVNESIYILKATKPAWQAAKDCTVRHEYRLLTKSWNLGVAQARKIRCKGLKTGMERFKLQRLAKHQKHSHRTIEPMKSKEINVLLRVLNEPIEVICWREQIE